MLPRKLKNYLLFQDAIKLAGEVSEVSLPDLKRKMEAYRSGDMGGEVDVDLGQEKIEFGFKAGGWFRQARQSYGASAIDANQWRFMGAYQSDSDGRVDAVEIVCRGRIMELTSGNTKAGDDTEKEYKISVTYYKETVNGTVDIEIDLINNVLISGGVDRNAEINTALGLDPVGGAIAAITGGV